MKTQAKDIHSAQNTLQALNTYFKGQTDPSRLRVSASGDIEIAGRLSILFDRFVNNIRRHVDKQYQPVDWETNAKNTVISKLEQTLNAMLPGQSQLIGERVSHLIGNINHQLKTSHRIPWQRALAVEIDLLKNTHQGDTLSNAIRVVMDIGHFTSSQIEQKVIEKIGLAGIDFAQLTDDSQNNIRLALENTLREHLMTTFDLPFMNSQFGAEIIMHAMISYQMNMEEAMALMHIPEAIMPANGFKSRPESPDTFIHEQIARTISQQCGVPLKLARKGAKNIEFCMRRYEINWKQALDLSALAQRIAKIRNPDQMNSGNPNPRIETMRSLTIEHMDISRAAQQVIARDRCSASHALQVVDRRIQALPEIQRCMPPSARPSILGGMQCKVTSSISEIFKDTFRTQVQTLQSLPKETWVDPSSNTDFSLADIFLRDSVRTLRIALESEGRVCFFDGRNPEELIPGILAFAGDRETMMALTDSFNQAILGTIMSMVIKENQNMDLKAGQDAPGTQSQLLWHSAKKDANGKIIIRHLFFQKRMVIQDTETNQEWPINRGPHWQGDISPVNAGWTMDFSYAFDPKDLKQGIRKPKILDCKYSFAISLDWDEIDQKLLEEEEKNKAPL